MNRAGQQQARRNASAHDRVAGEYDSTHGEIFNETEQARLHSSLASAASGVATGVAGQLRALDFGCGTGNVTRHLLDLGFAVTATDVSRKSLAVLLEKYSKSGTLVVKQMSDAALADETPGCFDMVATYSVLHHMPDYLRCIQNLARLLKPGGVLYVDHEVSPQYWTPSPALAELRTITHKSVGLLEKLSDPRRVLNPRWWYETSRRVINPRYMPEGDLHVWPDDHIEWDRIVMVLGSAGVEVVLEEDYLVSRPEYDRETYFKYAAVCSDMRLLVARRPQL